MTHLLAYEWLLLAAVVLVGLEVLTGAYVALSLAVGCVAVALADYLSGGASLYRDAALFALAGAAAAVALRWVFGRPGDSKRAEGDVNEY